MLNLTKIAEENINELKKNIYPGRGIVQGLTPDGKNFVQIYWIMGRSENSRNRVFVEENGFVRTHPHDASKMKDPSLIIYYPVKCTGANHIVSNGDQTDTVYDAIQMGKTFEAALETRQFEPDEPNYTPRITGIIDLKDKLYSYKLSVLKSFYNDPSFCERFVYSYEKAHAGFGHCVHTYNGDGNPLPSFSVTPYIVPVYDDIEKNLSVYWDTLNSDNRISLLVKFIDKITGETAIKIKNCHK